jgi:hypothetical protein
VVQSQELHLVSDSLLVKTLYKILRWYKIPHGKRDTSKIQSQSIFLTDSFLR